jgi:4-carboxymuconolactone decarboxylase
MKALRTIAVASALALSTLCAQAQQVQEPERFARITTDKMTPDQKKYFDNLMSGPVSGTGSAAVIQGANSVAAPFNVYMRSPKLAEALRLTGEQLRFHSSMPAKLNEFAIIITAQKWSAQYEWYAHNRLAIKAGLDPKISDQLAKGQKPVGMSKEEEAVYNFCTEMHETHQVSDATFNTAKELFGEQGVVDLIAVSGYYVMVSMILNVNRTPLPAGATPAFPGPTAAKK